MSHRTLDRLLAAEAAASFGILTHATAARFGASDDLIHDRIRAGRWQRLYRGVYVLAGVPPSREQAILAACFACGDGAAASHETAGALWALPGVRSCTIDVSVPRGRRPRPVGVRVHQVRWERGDTGRLGPIPITTPARTLIDLSSCLSPTSLEEALDDALTRRLTNLPSLRRRMESAGSRRGIEALRSLVAARDPLTPPPQSPLETRMDRLLRQSRFPSYQRQYPVNEGRRRALLDFAWPSKLVAVEVDGYRYHAGRQAWENDRARQNMLGARGWLVIHVTARDLERPAEVVERVRAALGLNR